MVEFPPKNRYPPLAVAVIFTKSFRLRSNLKLQRVFNFFEIYAKDVQALKIALKCDCGAQRSRLKIKLYKTFVLVKNSRIFAFSTL